MKRWLWSGFLACSLWIVFLACASEKMTLESLGLTVQPPEAYVVLRESTDKGSGTIRVIIETRETDGPQIFLRAHPLKKKEESQFSAMEDEELQSFLRDAGMVYADARASLVRLGSGKTGLEVQADEGRYYALYAVQGGTVVSAAVASNQQALTDADRQSLAELLQSMRWQSKSENDAGAALQRNARRFARHIDTTLAPATEAAATADPGVQEDAELHFR